MRTSRRLNWPGVEVHHYRLTGELDPEVACPFIGVFLPQPDKPYKAEMRIGGEILTAQIDRNSVSIVPAGQSRTMRRDTSAPYEVTAVFLDPQTLTDIARAETGVDFPEIIPQLGIADPLIHSIGMLLDAELASENPKSRIYAESLAGALAAQIFARYTRPCLNGISRLDTRWPQLRRSVEFINQSLDKDLYLSDIAAVANMSKYHFSKSFREVIGMPPHQYLVKLRMEKARKLLKDTALSLEEVAYRVGYVDPAHFSKQFLKVVGSTPKRYRESK